MTRTAVEPGSVGIAAGDGPEPVGEHEGLCERLERKALTRSFCDEPDLINPDGPEAATTIRAQAGEIDRLTAALAKANEGFEEYERRFYLEQDARETQAAELERLRGALEPFARAADAVEREYGSDRPDGQYQFAQITMGDLRRARAARALSDTPPEKNGTQNDQ